LLSNSTRKLPASDIQLTWSPGSRTTTEESSRPTPGVPHAFSSALFLFPATIAHPSPCSYLPRFSRRTSMPRICLVPTDTARTTGCSRSSRSAKAGYKISPLHGLRAPGLLLVGSGHHLLRAESAFLVPHRARTPQSSRAASSPKARPSPPRLTGTQSPDCVLAVLQPAFRRIAFQVSS